MLLLSLTVILGEADMLAVRYLLLFFCLSINLLQPSYAAEIQTLEQAEAALSRLNQLIAKNPKSAANYVERGDVYYATNDMPRAVEDYSRAIKLDSARDQAYFGRGMALARMGRIDEGIADLTVYIKRHPDSSVAYTKRGVRNIWKGDVQAAERDLTRAIELDANNAEAHDDLGVVHAKQNRLRQAAKHFSKAIELDPTYQKAFHNLAILFHVSGQHQNALETVDSGLKLNSEHRGSIMLKSSILKALGKTAEAQALAEQAEFLPDENWTERTSLTGR